MVLLYLEGGCGASSLPNHDLRAKYSSNEAAGGSPAHSTCSNSPTINMGKEILNIMQKTSLLKIKGRIPNMNTNMALPPLKKPCLISKNQKNTVVTCNDALQRLDKQLARLSQGIMMEKVTRKKKKVFVFKTEAMNTKLTWKNGAKYLEIGSIKDIRTGPLASNYREEYGIPANLSSLWTTVIYRSEHKLKALHVIANNSYDFECFFDGIKGLVQIRQEMVETLSMYDNERFLSLYWKGNDGDQHLELNDKELNFQDIKKICDKFKIRCSNRYLHKLFMDSDTDRKGSLNFHDFQYFVKSLKERKELLKIWEDATSVVRNHESMTLTEFGDFLTNVQKETLTQDEIYDRFMDLTSNGKTELNYKKFVDFISSEQSIINPCVDYNQPLNNYFISSSHNTYLLGKQFGESASVEGYIQALQQGCRCVEIDIWDGESGPVVCHGVLTGAIPLSSVLKVLKRYAFIASPYPLILSIEINCNNENQIKASNIIVDILGDLLHSSKTVVTKATEGDGFDIALPLCSPAQLKHKIIIKAKRTKSHATQQSLETQSGLDIESYTSSSYDTEDSSSSSTSMNLLAIPRIRRLKSKKNIKVNDHIMALSWMYGIKFRNFSLPESKLGRHCFSLNDKRLLRMCQDPVTRLAVDKHNRSHMMRVYPNAMRYNSSNFDPIPLWHLGVQMVALNWQTYDTAQQLNLAMFRTKDYNGSGAGYTLKPAWLRRAVQKKQEILDIYRQRARPVALRLRVLSAQLLESVGDHEAAPEPGLDAATAGDLDSVSAHVLVEVLEGPSASPAQLAGLHAGRPAAPAAPAGPAPSLAWLTLRCPDNAFNPTWDSEAAVTFHPPRAERTPRAALSLSFLRFTVYVKEQPVATTTVRLAGLKQGYRHLPLYSMEGERYVLSNLFIFSTLVWHTHTTKRRAR